MSQPVVLSVCVLQGSVWERPMSQPVVLSVRVFQEVSERDP